MGKLFKSPEVVQVYVRNGVALDVETALALSMMLAQLPHWGGWLYVIPEPLITQRQYDSLPTALQLYFDEKTMTLERK